MISSAGDREDLPPVPGRSGDQDTAEHGDEPADDSADSADAGDEHAVLIALTMARAIVAVVFCGFAVIALLFVLHAGKGAGAVTLAVACLGGLLTLQYFYFCRPSTDLHSRQAYGMLAVQAGLAYLPLIAFGQSWVSQPSFLAGSVLLVLPLPLAWPAYGAIVASTAVIQAVISGVLLDVVYVSTNAATAGLFVYGLTRLARLVTTLHEARDELAKTAVAHERLRFARHLHDLLGLSLSAIAPKGELTLRLLRRNPERARQELSEILDISRRALAGVRSIARVYREISLSDEAASLSSMLAASNVELRIDLDHGDLPMHMRTSLATVLREGVAQVLRQGTVERCEIVLRRQGDSVSVDVVDDGIGDDPGTVGRFDDLSAMVTAMGGELTVGVDADGRLRLHVTLPVAERSPDRPVDAVAEPAESIPHFATKLAGGLVATVFVGLFVQAVQRGLYFPQEFWAVAMNVSYLLAALGLQLGYFSRPGTRLRSPTSYLLLGALGVLVYVPWLQFQDEAWMGLPGFLAGSALLVLRPAAGWSVFAAVVGSVAWTRIAVGGIPVRDIGADILVTVDLGLITYGLTWMARTVRQLRVARQELAEVALAETRLRFARDLHDLLGLSLSAITLKCELAYRLLLVDSARARTELVEVLEIARHALADVRSVASGYHEMSLEEECHTAESLLTTAELDVRMAIDHGALPAEVSTVLATVLREGVTNVLRHSKGERCEISIQDEGTDVVLRIVNDGVTKPPAGHQWGSGIHNMSDRVAALGGVLTAGFDGADDFTLLARVPVRARTTALVRERYE